MTADVLSAQTVRRGQFTEAYKLLQDAKNDVDRTSLAEVLKLLGHPEEALGCANQLLSKWKIHETELAARCTLVLADCEWQAGNLEKGAELSHRAHRIALSSGHHGSIAKTALYFLERTSATTGFDGSLPLAGAARRAVIRCPDAQIHALGHLTFGRLEAKAGRFSLAHKHFALTRQLLASDPNAYLSSSVDLDESVVLWITGDVPGGIQLAENGARVAKEIGWAKGSTAADCNLACLYVCAGRLSDAHRLIHQLRRTDEIGPSIEAALTDTEARAAFARGDYLTARRIIDQQSDSSTVQPWYRLTREQTRIQLMLRDGDWQSALELANAAGVKAEEAKLATLAATFRLISLEASLGAGVDQSVEEFSIPHVPSDWPLNVAALGHSVLGQALVAKGHYGRGAANIRRAGRLWREVGEVITTCAVSVRRPNDAIDAGSPLDAAVALFELSGHPHILAREAVAMVQETGCAAALALVARSARGLRVIDAHGWSADEAVAAARGAAADDFIVVGQHRDETWQILARPRPALDHRCSLAAIRKLVDMARTLDGYRRDEKQRAALWPAEALEGDAESLWISERSAEVLSIARRIASAPLPILLTGETGTGKEMLARVIHRASDRADRPLYPFNCTAVPKDMLESQLFGYRKGAFTGAESSFPGVLRAADGATLFLDEIGDIGLDVQPKLLRFLEHQEVHPLGEPHALKVDVRIIAATNANLEALVADGRFREDLLYRLNPLRLDIPPLRERREEIPPLVQHYIRKFADEQRKGHPTLSDETLEYLLLYNWPGNLRQLANEIRRMIALADADATLTPALLSKEILASRRTIAAPPPGEPEISLRLDQTLPAAVEALEQSLIRRALERTNGRVEDAAQLLGISRKGLFLKRRRWGLQQRP